MIRLPESSKSPRSPKSSDSGSRGPFETLPISARGNFRAYPKSQSFNSSPSLSTSHNPISLLSQKPHSFLAPPVFNMSDLCPVYAPFFGAMGCTASIVFTCEFSSGVLK
ncbi:hypothetical protein JAAARDRAFT_449336 [Jaapia argillacea MUCL 33604]|uniref:Uncharacterized protein n=1 Tax=Jaapia argillacea MUCL 33604 TaxID=933084 RepID=A0A067Q7E4_9AGAM|nr:hypothetical protein JAAARDRAFT_449336 [Jaapia argillacea MUCL 33604]